jgi:hypothetical protein
MRGFSNKHRRMGLMRIFGLMTAALLFGFSAMADDAQTVAESKTKWEAARKACGGNYSYKVRWSSFTGSGHETEVVVKGNKVVQRQFTVFNGAPQPIAPGAEPAKPKVKWLEVHGKIGSHKEGAPAKTLDELYSEAATVAKRQLGPNEKRYVRVDKQGLLRSCFWVDTRIADDAPTHGIIISSLNLVQKGVAKVHTSPSGKQYPEHWGAPPLRQTRDLRRLPGGYGRGSGTLAKWIQANLDKDAKKK